MLLTITDTDALLAFLSAYIVIVIVIVLIVIVISAVIGSLITALWYLLSFKWVAKDADKTNYGALYVTSLVSTFIYLVPCAGIFLVWLYISKRHTVSYGKAFLVWLVAILISAVVSAIFSYGSTFIFGGFEVMLEQIMTLIATLGA